MMQSQRRLHVAVVTEVFPKLSETFVLDHVIGLLDRGIRVTVVATPPRTDEPRPPAAAELEITRVLRSRLPTSLRGRLTVVLSAVRPLGSRRLLAAVLRSRRERIGAVRSVIEAQTVAKLPPDIDILHCHFGPVGAAVLGGAREAGLQLPIVTTFHGYDVSMLPAPDRLYAGLFEDPRSLLLPVSDRWRQLLIEAGAAPERTSTLRVGIDLETHGFAPTSRSGGPLRVLSVGRMVEKKGFSDAAEAVAKAIADGHNVHWTVIGDGPMRKALERRVAREDIRAHVELAGRQPRTEVMRRMRSSHVLLAPSKTARTGDMEGIPVVLMEAMASGLPAVSTRHSAIPELVVEGVSGLLCDEGDVAGLSSSLGQLDQDEPFRQRLSTAGRERVAELHDAQDHLDRLIGHYRSLLGSPTTGNP